MVSFLFLISALPWVLLMALLLLVVERGPVFPQGTSLFEVLGYSRLFLAAVLLLRVLMSALWPPGRGGQAVRGCVRCCMLPQTAFRSSLAAADSI